MLEHLSALGLFVPDTQTKSTNNSQALLVLRPEYVSPADTQNYVQRCTSVFVWNVDTLNTVDGVFLNFGANERNESGL